MEAMQIRLPITETNEHTSGKAHVRFSKKFPREYKNSIMERLRMVVEYFPEYWVRTIEISQEKDDSGFAGRFIGIDDMKIKIKLVKDADLWTIAHELFHGVQVVSAPVPKGEKACDLYCLARSYNYAVRDPPYLNLPDKVRENWYDWAEVAHFVAQDAIKRRDAGLRRYIKFFEDKMAELVEESKET